MNWPETFRTGWDAIRSHRLRSGLTMLGILIGIAAVVLTVGLGLGSQQEVGARISSLGSNLLIVSPGSSTTTGGLRGGAGSASTLTITDANALASGVAAPDIAAVAPIKNSSLSLTAGSANWTTTVVGTSPSWLSVRARTLAEGRFLTDQDDTEKQEEPTTSRGHESMRSASALPATLNVAPSKLQSPAIETPA